MRSIVSLISTEPLADIDEFNLGDAEVFINEMLVALGQEPLQDLQKAGAAFSRLASVNRLRPVSRTGIFMAHGWSEITLKFVGIIKSKQFTTSYGRMHMQFYKHRWDRP